MYPRSSYDESRGSVTISVKSRHLLVSFVIGRDLYSVSFLLRLFCCCCCFSGLVISASLSLSSLVWGYWFVYSWWVLQSTMCHDIMVCGTIYIVFISEILVTVQLRFEECCESCTMSPHNVHSKKSISVCETLQYAPGGNKVEKAIFSFKVKVKVTRSLTLVSIERASLVEYACQIWSLYLLRFKSYSEG